jgi:hypothetical protein
MRLKNLGKPIYHRGPEGYDLRRVFKPMVMRLPEGNFMLQDIDGKFVALSGHTFEQARRRVTNTEQPSGVDDSEYPRFTDSQIGRLVEFCFVATERRNDRYVDDKRPYGWGSINLLLEASNTVSSLRHEMLNAFSALSSEEIRNIKVSAYENAKIHNPHKYRMVSEEEGIEMQKVKFSCRTPSGYPVIMSFMNSDPNIVIVNTMYQQNDTMPINTILLNE